MVGRKLSHLPVPKKKKKPQQKNCHFCLQYGNITVDTQFCTHDLIKDNDLNDYPCTLKIMIALHTFICFCITCINHSLHYMHQFIHCIL